MNEEVDQTIKNTKYGSLSVSHVNVPDGHNYMVKNNLISTLLSNINKFWKVDGCYFGDGFEVGLPSTGFYNFDEILVWILNQHKNGFIYLYFKNQEDFKNLQKIITEKNNNLIKKIVNPIYRYCVRSGWVLSDQYETKNAEKDIFGYDDYIAQIEKDISNHIKYNDFLKELGENRSINYLLYGPPGTGKTSMIKSIASKFNCSVFIVNAGNVGENNVASVLSPKVKIENECKIKLLLFEDFDRFLGTDGIDLIMSQILNSLDGLDDKGDTIRFFTANNESSIYSVDALINRMSAKYQFRFPTIQIFRGKLKRLLSFYESNDEHKIEEFLSLVITKNITVRPFVNYVIRYLFDTEYLDNMIKNIDELK